MLKRLSVIFLVILMLCGTAFAKENKSENASTKFTIIKEGRPRYDDAPVYYVLMSPINTDNDKFKNDIKSVVQSLIKEKGSKFTAKIFDNKKALEADFKFHEANPMCKLKTKSELNFNGLHMVAWFDGNLKTGTYFNSLCFFPGGSDIKKVSKYCGDEEYNENLNTVPNNDYENKMADRKKKFENQLSSWDGSHPEVIKAIKSKMKNDGSFEHIKTTYADMKDYFVVITTFKGTNSFGATVKDSVKAKISIDGNFIEFFK